MTRHNVLVKVYGHLWPADEALLRRLAPLAAGAMPEPQDTEDPVLTLEGDLLRISFEGVYFPVDDVLAALAARLTPQSQGKLDYLDLEAWRLTRHTFRQGGVHSSSAPLNNVLAHSGH